MSAPISSRLGYGLRRDRLPALDAPAGHLTLAVACDPELADELRLLELRDGPEYLADQNCGRRVLAEVVGAVRRHKLDAHIPEKSVPGKLDHQVAGEPRRVLDQHNGHAVVPDAL